MHMFSCSMVALGTLLSAFWVLAANSWMQTPQGAILGKDKVFHVGSLGGRDLQSLISLSLRAHGLRELHNGHFVVAGVTSIFLLRKTNREFAETGLSLAMWILLFRCRSKCSWAISTDKIRDSISR